MLRGSSLSLAYVLHVPVLVAVALGWSVGRESDLGSFGVLGSHDLGLVGHEADVVSDYGENCSFLVYNLALEVMDPNLSFVVGVNGVIWELGAVDQASVDVVEESLLESVVALVHLQSVAVLSVNVHGSLASFRSDNELSLGNEA